MSAYQPLELGTPGKAACPDQYSQLSTLYCPSAVKLTIQTSLAGVYLTFGTGIGGVQWGVEEPYMPVTGSITRSFDAVRVRNLVAGQAAQVLLIPVPE